MRLCQPSPHVAEHTLHADHSSPEAESTEEVGWVKNRGIEGEKEEKERRGPELITMQDAASVAKRGRVVV